MNSKNTIPTNSAHQSWQEISDEEKAVIKAKINLETSTVQWQEVEKFFAQGNLIALATDLDLVEIAWHIEEDHAEIIAPLIENKKLGPVDIEQAKLWQQCQQELWCVVVKPFVLVQAVTAKTTDTSVQEKSN